MSSGRTVVVTSSCATSPPGGVVLALWCWWLLLWCGVLGAIERGRNRALGRTMVLEVTGGVWDVALTSTVVLFD